VLLTINAINEDYSVASESIQILNKPILVMSFLVYPLIDTLRVFILRIFKGSSPFKADKNHIHHHFEKIGVGHGKTSLSLFFYSILIVVFLVFCQLYLKINNPSLLLSLQIIFSTITLYILYKVYKKIYFKF
jgi:hypothetical protein